MQHAGEKQKRAAEAEGVAAESPPCSYVRLRKQVRYSDLRSITDRTAGIFLYFCLGAYVRARTTALERGRAYVMLSADRQPRQPSARNTEGILAFRYRACVRTPTVYVVSTFSLRNLSRERVVRYPLTYLFLRQLSTVVYYRSVRSASRGSSSSPVVFSLCTTYALADAM